MKKANGQFKVGDTVKWKRKNGLPAKGKIVKFNNTPSGPWYDIAGPLGTSRVRPAVLKAG